MIADLLVKKAQQALEVGDIEEVYSIYEIGMTYDAICTNLFNVELE